MSAVKHIVIKVLRDLVLPALIGIALLWYGLETGMVPSYE